MHFASTFSLFSLVGLGLATPVSPRDDAAATNVDPLSSLGDIGGLGLGGLGLRREKKQDVRRRGVALIPASGIVSEGIPREPEPARPAGDEEPATVGTHEEQGIRRRGTAVIMPPLDVIGRDPAKSGIVENSATIGTREEQGEAQAKDKPKSKSDGKGKGKGEADPKAKGKGKGKGKGKSEGKGKGKCNDARHTPCLHTDDVDVLVDAYVRMLSKWNDTDAKYLADSFRDTSDSINILAGIPLGSPTFPTKQAFIDHQHTQPDNLPLEVTHRSPYSCDEIALIWKATFGAAQKSVRGVTIIGATKDKGYWQIKTIDVEFNNIAYLLDIGGTYTLPGQ